MKMTGKSLKFALRFFFFIFFLTAAGCLDRSSKFGLTIGDSHGAVPTGWVSQLKKLRPQDSIMNVAVSGNTIGFDNLGRSELNELKSIHYQLAQTDNTFARIDYIIILIGTNDCKAVFDSLQAAVPQNLEELLSTVKNYNFTSASHPMILVVTPPPIADDEIMETKYIGAKRRLQALLPHYKRLADKYGCRYLDINTPLKDKWAAISPDGIHLSEEGYREIAALINQRLSEE
jgi:lysophospholipase L1-like esterase